MSKIKICTKCKEEKPEDEFRFRQDRGPGRVTVCKICATRQNTENSRLWRQKNPEEYKRRRFAADLKRYYGITVEEFESKVFEQNGKCPICSRELKPGKGRHVDHCHRCRIVRSITCGPCNTAMGLASENPDTLRKMAEYIERHQERCKNAN